MNAKYLDKRRKPERKLHIYYIYIEVENRRSVVDAIKSTTGHLLGMQDGFSDESLFLDSFPLCSGRIRKHFTDIKHSTNVKLL